MLELASENMRETKNKSTVNHGCGSHAILRCGETMVDVQDVGITKDFGNLAHGKRDALSCSNNEGEGSISGMGRKENGLSDISYCKVGKKWSLFRRISHDKQSNN